MARWLTWWLLMCLLVDHISARMLSMFSALPFIDNNNNLPRNILWSTSVCVCLLKGEAVH